MGRHESATCGHHRKQAKLLVDSMEELNLHQTVHFPTRKDNTLDLLLTSRASCESQLAVGSSGLNAHWSYRDWLSSSSVLAWSWIAQSVCQRVFSLLAIWCLRPWVRILHAAEEDDMSPSNSNITYMCQSIEIYNNKQCQHDNHPRPSQTKGGNNNYSTGTHHHWRWLKPTWN